MKFIFHIGAGKTGSSSIQSSLQNNSFKLKEKGIWYLGMMLNNIPMQKYNWQKHTSGITVKKFHELSEAEASKQILDVLHPAIKYAQEKNYHTLIWSNESFFGRRYNFIKALETLQNEGITVEILIYVRDHASWSQSAYIQWGIKHKSYDGKFKSFSEWIDDDERFPFFYRNIHRLDKKIPNTVNVHNMSACKDVVLDFYHYIGLQENSLEVFRDNDSPSNTELFLRAIFNSRFNTKMLVRKYDLTFGTNITYDKTPKKFLEELLPNKNDLLKVDKRSNQDRLQMNNFLLQQGQKPLREQNFSTRAKQVNTDELIVALSQMITEQALRIDKLEKKLNNIHPNN